MPPVTERAPSTPAPPLSGRRFISRITSPFASSKSRFVADFYIELDDPHRQYSPGDLVAGSVKLRITRPVRVTHLVVCLHGYAQVYKNPSAPPDSYKSVPGYAGPGKGRKNGEYYGNGFATLFEDEQVLCGDGRLSESFYVFKFNLEFPDRDLPSSITFERGTISYLITATLTRPTTISPTMQCEHLVYYVERIDIAGLSPTSARTITLEPIPRKVKTKGQSRKLGDTSSAERKSHRSDVASINRRASQNSSTTSSRVEGDRPRSPTLSEQSEESLDSSGGGTVSQQGSNSSPRQSDAGRVNSSLVSLPAKTITVSIESLTGGCLRGDSVNLKVTVNHTKHVKSLYGVIITLFRQARVDLHPEIPIGVTEKGKSKTRDDYYPRSITGLGGLSLSGAGSHHVFRKDLSQIILPLIVDPATLTAEINGKVRVPDEAFPTISTVPGAMISFRYYIEVIVDVQGKLSTQDRNLGNLGGFATTINQSQPENDLDRERSAYAPFGTPLLDTATVRRDKSIVSSMFEIVVGTKDSSRRKGKQKVEASNVVPSVPETAAAVQPPAQIPSAGVPAPVIPQQQDASTHPSAQYPNAPPEGAHGYQYDNNQWYEGAGDDPNDPHAWDYHPHYGDHNYGTGTEHYDDFATPIYSPDAPLVSPPPQEDEAELTEKERIRRAEARLLPSQPPGLEEEPQASSASAPDQGSAPPVLNASAPYISQFEDDSESAQSRNNRSAYNSALAPTSVQFYLTPPTVVHTISGSVTPSHEAAYPPGSHHSSLTRTPDYEVSPSRSYLDSIPLATNSVDHPTDDKNELAARLLQSQASAPPSEPPNTHLNATSPSSASPTSALASPESQPTYYLREPHLHADPALPSAPVLGVELSLDDDEHPSGDEHALLIPASPPSNGILATSPRIDHSNDNHDPGEDFYHADANDSHADANPERRDLPRYEQ